MQAWQENCGCPVSQLITKQTGHLFMAHRSLTKWTRHTVKWLSRNGVEPKRSRAVDRIAPPQSCERRHGKRRCIRLK